MKAPYNFVPFSELVVFPDEWSSKISLDIPFSDGISGTIAVKLTALTPIFIRNGNTLKDRENNTDEFLSFSNITTSSDEADKTRYFIPGTSVKGMIRNIFEIMTFGKLRLDTHVQYAQRDWDNKSLYPLKNEQNQIHCGWLKKRKDGGYEIIDCGLPYRIAQTRIDTHLKNKIFEDYFSKELGVNLNNQQNLNNEEIDPKTAYFKYRLIEEYASLENLRNLSFSFDEEHYSRFQQRRLKVDEAEAVNGTIVLTGQPNSWTGRTNDNEDKEGKFFEFVFSTPNPLSPRKFFISEADFNRYKLIYNDSPDWKYAYEKFLPTSGMPVFFRTDQSNKSKIMDWGLAFLYRLPYKRTPFETLPENHKSEKMDMADCVFGFTTGKTSLKGRVQVTPFWSENASIDTSFELPLQLVLSSPKSTYYPIYIRQEDKGKSDGTMEGTALTHPYNTFDNGMIKGWKRYINRNTVWTDKMGDCRIDTLLKPLKKESVFEGRINFHNLKPEELGALLSSLTFHGNENTAFHQLGMAKPYGFGKVKIEITDIILKSVGDMNNSILTDYRSYMAVFEDYMNKKIGNELWVETNTIKELFTLASCPVNDNNPFNYMKLEIDVENDFKEAKGGQDQEGVRYYLQYFSNIIHRSFTPSSLCERFNSDLALSNRQKENQIESFKLYREKMNRLIEDENAEKTRLDKQKQEEEERKKMLKEDEERLAIIESGLSFLDEVKSFKEAFNSLNTYLNRINSKKIPDMQWLDLKSVLLRLSKKPNRDERRKNIWSNPNSKNWQFIETITTKEFAHVIFKEINP